MHNVIYSIYLIDSVLVYIPEPEIYKLLSFIKDIRKLSHNFPYSTLTKVSGELLYTSLNRRMPLPKKTLRSFVRDFKDDFKGLSLSLSETKTREIAIQLGGLNGKQGTLGSHTVYADSIIQSSESTSSVESSPINIGSPVNIGLHPRGASELLLFLFHCVSLMYSR